MLNSIFSSFTSSTSITLNEYIICVAVSLIEGIIVALAHSYKCKTSKNFLATLVFLPTIVQTVIMIVNGNLGTGVAVLGAFSLIRFRSVPGNSKEIMSVFLTMAAGIGNGMGYVSISFLLIIIVAVCNIVFSIVIPNSSDDSKKELKIIIPENMNYMEAFDAILEKFTKESELVKVKTTNMGSLYELHYVIREINDKNEKQMLDEIRVINGNLNVTCHKINLNDEGL